MVKKCPQKESLVDKDKHIENLENSVKHLNKKIAELVREAQLKVEDYLSNETLTIALREQQDKDFIELEIIGIDLHLKGKAYKVPVDNKMQETILSVIYIKKAKASFSE